jgi:hypothetical protein
MLIISFVLLHQLQTNNYSGDQDYILPNRESQIPVDAVKVTPETDFNCPKSMSDEYYDPVPVDGYVNTAGAEDSAFVVPDGSVLYFFFVPDVRVPVEEQVLDPTVGIYLSKNVNGIWSDPIRVVLQEDGKLAMDGCEFVFNDVMYFCSVREGYTGIHWFRAQFLDGEWQNWENADSFLKTGEYETGELHISLDRSELYFHSVRAGGEGGLDIWVSKIIDGEWSDPLNVEVVNSEFDEGWPALSPSGDELWFSRSYGVWRSKRVGGEWQDPELMFSPLCGEPSIDEFGNVYFTHHFFEGDVMIEADIYVAVKK